MLAVLQVMTYLSALRTAQLWLRGVTANEILAIEEIATAETRSWLRLFPATDAPFSHQRFWGAFIHIIR